MENHPTHESDVRGRLIRSFLGTACDTMISQSASNWVDRGEDAEPKLAKSLRHFLGFDAPVEDAELRGYADTLVGMVAADASEVQIAAYLGYLEDQLGGGRSPAAHRPSRLRSGISRNRLSREIGLYAC